MRPAIAATERTSIPSVFEHFLYRYINVGTFELSPINLTFLVCVLVNDDALYGEATVKDEGMARGSRFDNDHGVLAAAASGKHDFLPALASCIKTEMKSSVE